MPKDDSHVFDPTELSTQEMYKLMIGSVVPRPIAWVSSLSKDGVYNLAPFSFFTVASRKPPTLLFSVGPGVQERSGTVKDTLTNIRETEQFVIHVVPEHLANAMHESSLHYPEHIDEFNKSQLTPISSLTVKPPTIKEAPIAFECVKSDIIQVGTDHLVLGQVKRVRVNDDVYLGNYKTNIAELSPLARLAGDYSTLTTPSFPLPRKEE
ncbi:hypothetical protein DH09_05450 [Bacillaceae bacterium JMAK1]|nr:hypothetical protein DH09_05450 [Bacillaceae bacterium JMAK1]